MKVFEHKKIEYSLKRCLHGDIIARCEIISFKVRYQGFSIKEIKAKMKNVINKFKEK